MPLWAIILIVGLVALAILGIIAIVAMSYLRRPSTTTVVTPPTGGPPPTHTTTTHTHVAAPTTTPTPAPTVTMVPARRRRMNKGAIAALVALALLICLLLGGGGIWFGYGRYQGVKNQAQATVAAVQTQVAAGIAQQPEGGTTPPQATTPFVMDSEFPTSPQEAAQLFGGEPGEWSQFGGNGWMFRGAMPRNITVPTGFRFDHTGNSCGNPGSVGTYGPTSVTSQWGTMWMVGNERNCGLTG